MKKFSLTILLLLFGSALIYWFSQYTSLRNPFDEMLYSETRLINLMNVTPLHKVVGSSKRFDETEVVSSLVYETDRLEQNEKIFVTVSKSSLNFFYSLEFDDDVYVGMYLKYDTKNKTLTQEVYISDQTVSDVTYKGDELLQQLSKYGKDLNWLQELTQKAFEERVLKLWFENGSSRYSLKHLGTLTIKHDPIFENME